MSFKEISIEEYNANPIVQIGKQWMLITAGTIDKGYNTMTASWGTIGSLWGEGKTRAVSTIYVRPQRYTKQFVDNNDYYSLSFFGGEYKKELAYLGTKSGKDEDKVANVNFEAVSDENTTWFKQASMVIICKKLYQAPIKEEYFIDQSVREKCYPLRDYHDMYIGEIVKILVKE